MAPFEALYGNLSFVVPRFVGVGTYRPTGPQKMKESAEKIQLILD
jgi:hypothetical protein